MTKNELKKAIYSSKNGKTPGWDGLPAEFYKKFDKQLLPLLLELANYSKDVGEMSNSQRVAIISLLHKGDEDDIIKNYRPILLLCLDVKIIIKVMALYLQNVLQ